MSVSSESMSGEVPGEVIFPPGDDKVSSGDKIGFCGGVDAADQALTAFTRIAREEGINVVHCLHAIVHNKRVTERHERNGVVFVDRIEDIPDYSAACTSAHGVGPKTIVRLQEKGCMHLDTACSLVVYTHNGVKEARKKGERVLYIAHGKPSGDKPLHDEIKGTLDHMDHDIDSKGGLVYAPIRRVFLELNEDWPEDLLDDRGKYHIISQTTLDGDATKEFRNRLAAYIKSEQAGATVAMAAVGNVCMAVRNRQSGIEQGLLHITPKPDRAVIITDPTSGNGKTSVERARNIVKRHGLGIAVYAVAGLADVEDIPRDGRTFLSASASTPDEDIREVALYFGADPEQLSFKRRPAFNFPGVDEASMREGIKQLVARRALL